MEYFIKLTDIIYEKIHNDLKNNIIALWHDESHLNHYYFSNNNNSYLLDISYHVQEEFMYKHSNINILYIDKSKNNNINKYKKNIKGKSNLIINDELINYYLNCNTLN